MRKRVRRLSSSRQTAAFSLELGFKSDCVNSKDHLHRDARNAKVVGCAMSDGRKLAAERERERESDGSSTRIVCRLPPPIFRRRRRRGESLESWPWFK